MFTAEESFDKDGTVLTTYSKMDEPDTKVVEMVYTRKK